MLKQNNSKKRGRNINVTSTQLTLELGSGLVRFVRDLLGFIPSLRWSVRRWSGFGCLMDYIASIMCPVSNLCCALPTSLLSRLPLLSWMGLQPMLFVKSCPLGHCFPKTGSRPSAGSQAIFGGSPCHALSYLADIFSSLNELNLK